MGPILDQHGTVYGPGGMDQRCGERRREEGGKGRREKIGPILDQHGTVYGPGSVVFTPSVDGSEYVEREEGGEGGRERREREERKEGEEGRRSTRDRVWTWKCRVHSFRGWIRVCGERERKEREEGGRRGRRGRDQAKEEGVRRYHPLFFLILTFFSFLFRFLFFSLQVLGSVPRNKPTQLHAQCLGMQRYSNAANVFR